MEFNRKSLTINNELKINLHVKQYYQNRWGLRCFATGYFFIL